MAWYNAFRKTTIQPLPPVDPLKSGPIPGPSRVLPFADQGTSGTAVYGGYVNSIEKDWRLIGWQKYVTASDLLANVTILAASVRYFLNLMGKATWTVDPVNDTAEAKGAAEFVESVMENSRTSFRKIIRRGGLYKYHGFNVQEWTAIRRKDGLIGYADVEMRPAFTIERWAPADDGTIVGMIQRSPQTGQYLYMPRNKVLYFVDDTLTDNPEGQGWFRNSVQEAELLRDYLKLEGIGYERDLNGIPIGRAPLNEINKAVASGDISQGQADQMIENLRQFVGIEIKKKDTGMVLDSTPYFSLTDNGRSPSSVYQWNVELLKGTAQGFDSLAKAIARLERDIARLMGTEFMTMGDGDRGSNAMHTDKTSNLYMQVMSTLDDMTDTLNQDYIAPLWVMNGFDEELMPTLKHGDIAMKDVEQMARTLRDMAAAGAVMAPDDPAIDDMREAMGLPPQEDVIGEVDPDDDVADKDADVNAEEAVRKSLAKMGL